ncbi:hypothetical protein J6590_049715 [Homalodisca vitripennis]|nr:hypothetical protein J6590_049715 [Homalodisca vitripennis]
MSPIYHVTLVGSGVIQSTQEGQPALRTPNYQHLPICEGLVIRRICGFRAFQRIPLKKRAWLWTRDCHNDGLTHTCLNKKKGDLISSTPRPDIVRDLSKNSPWQLTSADQQRARRKEKSAVKVGKAELGRLATIYPKLITARQKHKRPVWRRSL